MNDGISGFTLDTVAIKDGSIFYAKAGQGNQTILFIHGFSQDWSSFIKIMQLLTSDYTVIAIDLPGIGRSINKREKYDAQSLAEMVHSFCLTMGITKPYIVGHDMGGMVVYAYARMYEKNTAGIALLDAPLPGTPDTDLMVKMPFLWHFALHRIPRVPEKIIHTHEFTYFKKSFFNRFTRNKTAITDEDIRRYANAYKERKQLAAGLGLYRAYKRDRAFMKNHRNTFEVPVLIIESDYGSKETGPVAKQLRELFYCKNVSSLMIKGCGHYIPEENPKKLYEIIQDTLRRLGSVGKQYETFLNLL